LIRAFLEDAMEGFVDESVHEVLASRVGHGARLAGTGRAMNASKSMNGYDVRALRRRFPDPGAQGAAAGLWSISTMLLRRKSRKPSSMRWTDFLTSEYANVHRGVHYLSGAATERYEEARRRIQRFLNAAHEDEIIYTKGGTEAINLVASSYLSPRIDPGDEIVLSVMEHHSNIVPWHFLRERQGAELKWVEVSRSRRTRSGRCCARDHAPNQTGRYFAHVQRARHENGLTRSGSSCA
jgi:hypothetical protein